MYATPLSFIIAGVAHVGHVGDVAEEQPQQGHAGAVALVEDVVDEVARESLLLLNPWMLRWMRTTLREALHSPLLRGNRLQQRDSPPFKIRYTSEIMLLDRYYIYMLKGLFAAAGH